jgi:adenine-specific DNA-methyltransferase
MPQDNTYEQQFLNALKDIFVGAKVEGDSGYINLMKIKSRYFSEGVFPHLMKDIDAACKPFEKSFREELFDKLYDFFKRYFSESGSIYFRNTAQHHNIYEKVYTDDRDVMLFWKTHMLYYVKTDRLFNSMEIEVDGEKFFFDVSGMELKRSNEKRVLTYALKSFKNGVITLTVGYSEKGRKTKVDEIVKAVKDKGMMLDEETLEKAFAVFQKQSEVDYFINKNAKAFLQEQFDLWMYQYVFKGESVFNETRLKQLQAIKQIAFKIIDFIAQFEDELVKVWNKPKFVLNSNYVITLDKITNEALLQKILKHKGMTTQLAEWVELGMVDKKFNLELVLEKDLVGKLAHPQYQYLPLDTKYFKDLELDILALFEDLDSALDGWLVHSENYQALNTLLPKFRERVKSIYIDPPFNLSSSDKFLYRTNYKDANWATLLENRLSLSKDYLRLDGMIFVRCDYNGNWIVRSLLDTEFGRDNLQNELFINRIKKNVTDKGKRNIPAQIDSLFAYKRSEMSEYINVLKRLDVKRKSYWHSMESAGIPGPRQAIIEGKTYYPSEGTHFKFTQKQLDEMYEEGRIRLNPRTDKPQYLVLEKDAENLDTAWTDIPGYSFTTGFQTENSEALLQRVLDISSKGRDIVMDFFLGSGTTTAVAQKNGNKWLGIEMGEHFESVVLKRMKLVLFGKDSGVSKVNDWEGAGFFKYYDLEQYEDALKKACYEDAPLFQGIQDAYTTYAFLRDLKMLDSVTLDKDKNKVDVHLETLYVGIDLAETLSCLTGKCIKRITSEAVEFQDGTSASLTAPDWSLIKPLVWW